MNTTENVLGKMSIGKLAAYMSGPAIVALITLSLYNIVDSIFVAQISENALAAISLSFPIQKMIIGIALGTAIGINSLLARKLGEKNNVEAKAVIINGFMLMLLSWAIVMVSSFFVTKYFFNIFTDNAEIIQLGKTYFIIYGALSIGLFMQIYTEKVMEAMGMSKQSMIVQITGALINLVLDPILIFGLGSIQPMGIAGAAIATVIGQSISAVLGMVIIYRNKKEYFNKITFKFDKNIIKQIYQVGFPSIMMESMSGVLVLVLNKVLISISELAVAYWGIYWKLQDFVITVMYGLNAGMIPIIAFNLGAKNKERIKKTIKVYVVTALTIAIISMLIFMLIPEQLLGMFNATNELLEIGIVGNRMLSIMFVFIALNLILSGIFQGIGKGKNSLIISLLRRLIINIPILILFGKHMTLEMVWSVFILSEVIAFIVAFSMFKKEKIIKNLVENKDYE